MANDKLIHPIKKLRDKHELTQGELGVILGQSGNFIAQIEGGFSILPEWRLFELCNYFGLDPDKFRGELKSYQGKQRERLLEKITQG